MKTKLPISTPTPDELLKDARPQFDGVDKDANLPTNLDGYEFLNDPNELMRRGDLLVRDGKPDSWVSGWADTSVRMAQAAGLRVARYVGAEAKPEVGGPYRFNGVNPRSNLPPNLDGFVKLEGKDTVLNRGDLLLDDGDVPGQWVDGLAGATLGDAKLFGWSGAARYAGGSAEIPERKDTEEAEDAERRALAEEPGVVPAPALQLALDAHRLGACSIEFIHNIDGEPYRVLVVRGEGRIHCEHEPKAVDSIRTKREEVP